MQKLSEWTNLSGYKVLQRPSSFLPTKFATAKKGHRYVKSNHVNSLTFSAVRLI